MPSAPAMATMAHTDDSNPLAMPASTVVAGPVRVASAISWTGRSWTRAWRDSPSTWVETIWDRLAWACRSSRPGPGYHEPSQEQTPVGTLLRGPNGCTSPPSVGPLERHDSARKTLTAVDQALIGKWGGADLDDYVCLMEAEMGLAAEAENHAGTFVCPCVAGARASDPAGAVPNYSAPFT